MLALIGEFILAGFFVLGSRRSLLLLFLFSLLYSVASRLSCGFHCFRSFPGDLFFEDSNMSRFEPPCIEYVANREKRSRAVFRIEN